MNMEFRPVWQIGLDPASPAPRRKLQVRADLVPLAGGLLAGWDLATIPLAGHAAALLQTVLLPGGDALAGAPAVCGNLPLVAALLAPLAMRNGDLFQSGGARPVGQVAASAGQGFAKLSALLLAIGLLTHALDGAAPGWLAAWMTLSLLGTLGSRLAAALALDRLERKGALRERVAIIGATPLSAHLVAHLNALHGRGVEVIGVFDDEGPDHADAALAAGTLDDLLEIGKRHHVDRAILAFPPTEARRALEATRRLKALDIEVALCPPQIGTALPLGRTSDLAGLPLTLLAHRPIRRWGVVLKAIEDRALGLLLTLVTLPLLALIALAIRLDSPGPVIFRQKRHGWNNTEFEVFKFRTMTWAGAAQATGAAQTRRGDKRVTRVGRFLRRSSLDELPQLFNVLLGQMSLVGPRPHPVAMRTENLLCDEIIAEYAHRHRVKPGMTGWAQVNGLRGATDTAEQVRRRVEHDIHYIENWSLLFDLKIIALTPLRLIFDGGNAF